MSKRKTKDVNTSAAGVSDAHAPHAHAAAEAQCTPRVVTTGGINESENPVTGPESADSMYEGEKVEMVAYGKNRDKVYLRPLPHSSASPHVAHVDWFAFTVTPPVDESPLWLINTLRELLPLKAIISKGKGWNGYKERHTLIGENETELGLLAFGGKSQRGSMHVELTGQGCSLVRDWQAVRAWGEFHNATITRIDLAHDDLSGQELTVPLALKWHEGGKFSFRARPPKAKLIDDLGTGDGKTLYIGERAHGKQLRIYEKGRQLGDPESPWVRVEVELRNKRRLIPWDTLSLPGNYLAGAYPCLDYISAEQSKIETISKAVKISYESSVKHLHQTGGKLINLMMQKHSGDAFAVVNELKREGVPRRLASYAAHLPDALPDDEE